MLFNCVVIIAKKQTAYCNPFRPVETHSDLLKPVETRFNPFRLTRLNLSKHVSIRSDLSRPVFNPLKHVQTCWFRPVETRFPSSIPPSPPSSPFSPFFLGGGQGRGEGGGGRGGGRGSTTMAPPEGGGGGRSPPPPSGF